MLFGGQPTESRELYPGMYRLHEKWVSRRRRVGNQQWFFNVGLAAPVPHN
jgi:hypothetical protein